MCFLCRAEDFWPPPGWYHAISVPLSGARTPVVPGRRTGTVVPWRRGSHVFRGRPRAPHIVLRRRRGSLVHLFGRRRWSLVHMSRRGTRMPFCKLHKPVVGNGCCLSRVCAGHKQCRGEHPRCEQQCRCSGFHGVLLILVGAGCVPWLLPKSDMNNAYHVPFVSSFRVSPKIQRLAKFSLALRKQPGPWGWALC